MNYISFDRPTEVIKILQGDHVCIRPGNEFQMAIGQVIFIDEKDKTITVYFQGRQAPTNALFMQAKARGTMLIQDWDHRHPSKGFEYLSQFKGDELRHEVDCCPRAVFFSPDDLIYIARSQKDDTVEFFIEDPKELFEKE